MAEDPPFLIEVDQNGSIKARHQKLLDVLDPKSRTIQRITVKLMK
uniref:Uncharacterized protein n=1 Tax=Oryza sativa subsp. japonica TaxID=39947 RepID=Q2QQ51_ORYSJ|nr:hypothetical protein LOC_Os12g32219 [Oryza sativa Japonica Group]